MEGEITYFEKSKNHGGLIMFYELRHNKKYTDYSNYIVYGSWDAWKNPYALHCKHIDCGSSNFYIWYILWKHVLIPYGKNYFKLQKKYDDRWIEPTEEDKKNISKWENVNGYWNRVLNVDDGIQRISLPDYLDDYDGEQDNQCTLCNPNSKKCYNCGHYV